MRIFQILPRRMRFEPTHPTSVELCVADWVAGSRYRGQTTVLAEQGDTPMLDIAVARWPPASRLASWRTGLAVRKFMAERGCDLLVAQQHIATAARIAMLNPGVPLILQTHNFITRPATGLFAALGNRLVRARLNRLAGMTFVSEATLRDFELHWPDIGLPRVVISNGFDFSAWNPSERRKNSVLVVGRARQDKGILEAALGVADFLARHPGWTTTFVLSEIDEEPQYVAAIRTVLDMLGERAELLAKVPFSVVKDLNETAAIALVPSKWAEPFGRTAVEAHAGGAALVSSGTGGLREISGDCALYLDAVTPPIIAAALTRLAAEPTLMASLAAGGAARARELWRLGDSDAPDTGRAPSICARLDAFYDHIHENWRANA